MKVSNLAWMELCALALVIGLIGALAYGWVFNIVKLVGIISDPLTGMFILRCVGIVMAPLGVVLGYF